MGHKILVTGASGFIAAHTILELLNHGYDVRVEEAISAGAKSLIDLDLV